MTLGKRKASPHPLLAEGQRLTWPPPPNSWGPNLAKGCVYICPRSWRYGECQIKSKTRTLLLTTKDKNNSDGFSDRCLGTLWPMPCTVGFEKLHSGLLQNALPQILHPQGAGPRHGVLGLGPLPLSLALSPFHFHVGLHMDPTLPPACLGGGPVGGRGGLRMFPWPQVMAVTALAAGRGHSLPDKG